jgi:acyl-coenzyme A thioesterase PaaI-like protein
MTVRFQQPARPGEELTATAELVTDRRGRIYEARGELRSRSGEVVATATGKYLPIPETEVAGMLSELVGDRTLLA